MNHQHHLKSDPKFGRFSRFSRGVDARVLRRVMRTGIMVVRWASAGPQSQGLRATVARPLGPRSQGLRGLRGFVRLNFRVANMEKSVGHGRNVRNVLNRAKT